MLSFRTLITILSLITWSYSGNVLAQSPEQYDENGRLILKKKSFSAGISFGSYFPNKYPSDLYDGYGFDYDGNKNVFENSWLNAKINYQYGGGYGQPDLIGQELGLPPEDWDFTEADMPVNMTYKTAFAIGFAGRYSVENKNAIILNVNAAIVTAAGNFTITTRPSSGSTQINNSIKTFNIRGKEQRLLFQAGYQRLFGNGDAFNFFAEGGLHATLAKFDKNEIQINNLQIDLFESYYDPVNNYTFFAGSKPVGLGFGAFAGFGANIRTSGKWMLQLVYDMSLENVKIAYNPKLKLNHAAGLRAYYVLGKTPSAE